MHAAPGGGEHHTQPGAVFSLCCGRTYACVESAALKRHAVHTVPFTSKR